MAKCDVCGDRSVPTLDCTACKGSYCRECLDDNGLVDGLCPQCIAWGNDVVVGGPDPGMLPWYSRDLSPELAVIDDDGGE